MVYKKWAFKFFIYTVILNIIVAYFVIQSTFLSDYSFQILIASLLATIFMLVGTVFGIQSYRKKEENGVKKVLGLYGNLGLFLFGIILQILGNV